MAPQRLYYSEDGCCVCLLHRSSSVFAKSGPYEPFIEYCFGPRAAGRRGVLCNPCVLKLKRRANRQTRWTEYVDKYKRQNAAQKSKTASDAVQKPTAKVNWRNRTILESSISTDQSLSVSLDGDRTEEALKENRGLPNYKSLLEFVDALGSFLPNERERLRQRGVKGLEMASD